MPEAIHPMSNLMFGIDPDPIGAFGDALRTANHISAISGRHVRVKKLSTSWLRHLLPSTLQGFTLPLPFFGSWVLIKDDLWGTHDGRIVLMHELAHVIQSLWLTPSMFLLSYLFFFPVLFTMRAKLEMEAFTITVQETIRTYGSISDTTLRSLASLFTGRSYFFMATSSDKAYRRLKASADAEQALFDGMCRATVAAAKVLQERAGDLLVNTLHPGVSLADIRPIGRA